MIQQEVYHKKSGLPARIIAKMNALDDPDVISSLEYAASQGVQIELYVRGGVAINPRAPGVAENLKIISIVGRFLEHSRIMYFANGKNTPLDGLFYLGSADWMSRNLNSRVELMVPIENSEVKGEIWDILQVFRQDSAQSWILNVDGKYSRNAAESLTQKDEYSAQERFLKFYSARSNRIVFLNPPQIQHGWQVFKEIERPKFD
jgi:polyphosphate kinase